MAKAKKKKDEGEVKAAPKKVAKTPKEIPEEEGVRGIIRLAGKDVRGHLPLSRALLAVKGIGHTTSRQVSQILAKELNVSPNVKVGTFDDAQIEKLDGVLMSMQEHGLLPYLMNRRKDKDKGKDVHNIMNDLVFAQRQDIEGEKKLFTWKGYRHYYGKKVRGQKTRNTGRKGMSLGVIRKASGPAAAAGKKDDKKKK